MSTPTLLDGIGEVSLLERFSKAHTMFTLISIFFLLDMALITSLKTNLLNYNPSLNNIPFGHILIGFIILSFSQVFIIPFIKNILWDLLSLIRFRLFPWFCEKFDVYPPRKSYPDDGICYNHIKYHSIKTNNTLLNDLYQQHKKNRIERIKVMNGVFRTGCLLFIYLFFEGTSLNTIITLLNIDISEFRIALTCIASLLIFIPLIPECYVDLHIYIRDKDLRDEIMNTQRKSREISFKS